MVKRGPEQKFETRAQRPSPLTPGSASGRLPVGAGHGSSAPCTLTSVLQLISDAGYQGEITSVSTACQQLEVFSRVLRTSLATILDGGEENLEKNLPEFAVSALLDVAQVRRRPFAWGHASSNGKCSLLWRVCGSQGTFPGGDLHAELSESDSSVCLCHCCGPETPHTVSLPSSRRWCVTGSTRICSPRP